PMGVTAVTETIFEAFLSDDRRKTLFHGHSFTANPLACTAALASLDLLLAEDCHQRLRRINGQHTTFAKKLAQYSIVRNVRILGTVIAFEIGIGEDGYINSAGLDLTQRALEKGIYLRPLGNTVYIMPPYCITEKEMDQVYTFLVQYIEGNTAIR
ncbi:MAG TPA: aminotransferase class III-fold pyridoxal phosphate-dependent enzyme, partial [Puia sp.]|nr:aminotransferase class III-fold pyridoxal phosphate-dependent enzyme [Puia sp.]